jgi:hypothetical protein
VWNDILALRRGLKPHCTKDGATHAFGNTEPSAIYSIVGVAARPGDTAWSTTEGTGYVEAPPRKHVAYYDAIHSKGNTVGISLHNVFGGAAPGATKRLVALSKRETDRTEYESWAADSFVPYYSQRLSAAIVTADAARCHKRLSGLKKRAADATRVRICTRPRPNGHQSRCA